MRTRLRFRGYFFLPADCLAATAALFLALALLAADCFWPDFFWFAFGDLSPIMVIFVFGLLTQGMISFAEDDRDDRGRSAQCKQQ